MCRAAVSQVASDLNNLFQNSNRGPNAGLNDNGITYTSILLNNAVFSFNDRALINNSLNPVNGVSTGRYQLVGYDALVDRTTVVEGSNVGRELFGFNFFRLGTQSTDPFPSPDDQRRVMIIDGTTREILFSFTPTGSAQSVRDQLITRRQEMIDAVNSVSAVSALSPFAQFASDQGLPAELASPEDDPDGDSVPNLLEFFSGSDPLSSSSSNLPRILSDQTGPSFEFSRVPNLPLSGQIMVSEDLVTWTPFTPKSSETIVSGSQDLETVSVRLPTTASGRNFATIVVSEDE